MELIDKLILEGEVLTDPVEKKVSPSELESYVKDIEKNNILTTTIFIFNDRIFEVNNAILRYKGHWIFWDAANDKFMPWCWKEDIDELINSCDDEWDIEDLNNNWTMYTDGTWDHFNVDYSDENQSFEKDLDDFLAQNKLILK